MPPKSPYKFTAPQVEFLKLRLGSYMKEFDNEDSVNSIPLFVDKTWFYGRQTWFYFVAQELVCRASPLHFDESSESLAPSCAHTPCTCSSQCRHWRGLHVLLPSSPLTRRALTSGTTSLALCAGNPARGLPDVRPCLM